MSRRGLFLGVATGVIAAVLAQAAAAQVATTITPDTAAAFATGTGVTKAGAVTTISGGVQTGGNLFHSFNTFNLASGETARWTAANAGSVANVINRVTGGGFSTISGTIDTTALPNADFYFINPAGVLFTAGARLDVPKAAYISTAADGLSFADGARFSTLVGRSSTFTMSAPQSFGFLGFENGILLDGVGGDFIGLGNTLSLSGANIGIRNASIAPLRFDLAAVGTQARQIALVDPLAGDMLDGQAVLLNSGITAVAPGKGAASVRIGAGDFEQIGRFLTASTLAGGDAGDLVIKASTVNIGGFVSSSPSVAIGTGDSGNVRITASSLTVGANGQVTSSTFGAGAAGDLLINADNVLIDGGSIGSDSIGAGATGRGGLVQIGANAVTVRNGGEISSTTNGFGNAGSIDITAGAVLVDNAGIDSITLAGTGNSGTVKVTANTLTLSHAGDIGTSSFSAGNAGTIQINAGKMVLTTNGNIFSTSSVNGGAAGDVTIGANNLSIDSGLISTDTDGKGHAGNVTIAATQLSITGDALVSSATNGAGAAGKVSITADQANFDFSEVHSQANEGSTGAAGTVLLNIGSLTATNQTVISSSTFGAGDAGTVLLNVGTLKATKQTVISSATFGDGDAGLVSIVSKDITLDGSGVISRALGGSTGAAGQVVIQTGTLTMVNGAGISSSTSSSGNAGGVRITATKVSLDSDATIESGAAIGSTGNGGTVSIVASDALTLHGLGSIVTSTLSSGNAGQLTINAGRIVVADGSLLSSRTLSATGGTAGAIRIAATLLDLESGGQIETSSRNTTTAGGITVASAGPITINGANSHIASENLSAAGGAAGSIAVSGAPILLSDGGAISTNAITGAAGDISIFVPNTSYLMLEGKDAPGVITTSSGPGTGGRITITDPLAVISNGGRILALGQARGANVQLKSDFFIRSADRVNLLSVDGVLVVDSQVSDVSAGTAIPDVAFLDASKVLRGQCPAARSSGVTSQLSLRAFGPYGGARTATAGVAPAPTCGAAQKPSPHRHRKPVRSGRRA
jgi:filamentous hemagglutinin family protein